MAFQVSAQWIYDWFSKQGASDHAIAEQWAGHLTQQGLEAEHADVPMLWSHVVTGKIEEVERHPNADRLRVCKVNIGQDDFLQIVCGCSTVRVGMMVAVAQVGAKLPNIKIKRSKIRDVESHGMLCSYAELGFGIPSSGIIELDAKTEVGLPLEQLMKASTAFLELEVTPNRGDWLSIRGVARELALSKYLDFQWEQPTCKINVEKDKPYPVEIKAPEECPIYMTAVVNLKDVGYDRMPLWLLWRMHAMSIHFVHPVVDILNYVMLEYGQPMHAFDLDKLSGLLEVRLAKEGETIKLLNGENCQLTKEMLVIADENGPQALAGVMGGEFSSVSSDTKSILIESAHFVPKRIAKACRHYRYVSDSAYRFERGVDPLLPELAINRAIELLNHCFPTSRVASPNADKVPLENRFVETQLFKQQVEEYLGCMIDTDTITASLGKIVQTSFCPKTESWYLRQPSYRFDLDREVNWISEVIRLVGYDVLESKMPQLPQTKTEESYNWRIPFMCSDYLRYQGYTETLSFTFVDGQSQQKLQPSTDLVRLKNPLSQTGDVLRQTLVLGLLKVAQYNYQRQMRDFKIFEWGNAYHQTEEVNESHLVAGVCVGNVEQPFWADTPKHIDFFDVKGHVMGLMAVFGVSEQIEFRAAKRSMYHPHKAADIICNQQVIGHLGILHPDHAERLDLPESVAMFEIDYGQIQLQTFRSIVDVSRFPSVKRDLSFWVNQAVSYADIKGCISNLGIGTLRQCSLFDRYVDDAESDRISMSISLVFQHTKKTLTEKDISKSMTLVLNALNTNFNIALRGGAYGFTNDSNQG